MMRNLEKHEDLPLGQGDFSLTKGDLELILALLESPPKWAERFFPFELPELIQKIKFELQKKKG